MKTRLAATLAWTLILFVTFTNMLQPFNNVLDVLCWMGYLLIVAVIILWPKSGKDNRAERAAIRGTWADKIDFDKMGDTGKA